MAPAQWIRRPGPQAVGLLVGLGCVALAASAFLRGDVSAELTWLALGAALYTLGLLAGTGRTWLPWGLSAGALVAALWWSVHPVVAVLVAAAAVTASVYLRGLIRARKDATRYLMQLAATLSKATKDGRDPDAILTPLPGRLIPNGETRRGVKVGLPLRWSVPPHVPVDDSARMLLGTAVAEVCKVPASYRVRRSTIDVYPAPFPAESDGEPDPDTLEKERINEAVRSAMGPELTVQSIEHDDAGKPEAVTLTWPATYTTKATSIAIRNRVGSNLSGVLDGDWNTRGWDTKEGRVTYRRMRQLETRIPHPGRDTGAPPDQVPFATLRTGGTAYMNLGSETPHCLIVGQTSQGKSSLLRTLLVGMPEGTTADLVDPKRISMQGLDQLDVVRQIATRPEDMARAIADFEHEMDERYEALEERTIRPRDLTPRVLVIDEGKMLFKKLDIWWNRDEKSRVKEEMARREAEKRRLIKEEGQTDGATDIDKLPKLPVPQGSRHPAIDQLSNLVMGGRQAKMFLILCSQRADADWIGGTDTRDQFSTVIALGNLGSRGSIMAFGNTMARDGLSNDKGRVWVGMGTGDKHPQQAQVWWVPAPGDDDHTAEDLAILESLGLSALDDEAPARARGHESAHESAHTVDREEGEEAPSPSGTEPHAAPSGDESDEDEGEEVSGAANGSDSSPHPAEAQESPTDLDPTKADHATASANSEAVGRTGTEGDQGADVGDELADDDDEGADRPTTETEPISALDLEEGDQFVLDLDEGAPEVAEVLAVEVDMHDPDVLEISYRTETNEGVHSLADDETVQRLVS